MADAEPQSETNEGAPELFAGSPAVWAIEDRLAWVRRFRKAVVKGQDDLIALAGEEVRKDAFEALVSDIVPLLSSCKWHERHARRVLRARRLRGGSVWQVGQRHWVRREPLGLVGIIATWNYPVQLLGIQLVQAVVAGNRVVVKPSERCPKTQGRLLEMVREAGLAEDWLRVLPATREAGAAMLEREPLDHLVFTGSTEVGRVIAAALGPRLVPSTLELSGRDTAIVLDDADIALAARSIGAAVRLNAGQTCMAPRRVLVASQVAEAFAELLREEAGRSTSMRLIDGSKCQARVEICGPDDALVRGAHFEPVIAVIPCESIQDMLRVHWAVEQHLATSVFTQDVAKASALAGWLGSGTVTINDAVIPTAHPGAPLPALGVSGWGVSRGKLGLLSMTRPVHVSVTSRHVRAPTAPPSAKQAEQVKGFVRWWYGR